MKKTKKNTGLLRDRGGIWILIVAALILQATACIQYFYSREGLRKEAEHRATAELRRAELEIDVICTQVEMGVKTMALLAERNLQYPDSMFSITCLIQKETPNMVGAAIAFKENFYPQYGKWFEAYCGYKTIAQIGNADHDYLKSEWFHNGMTIDSCWWCEPYFDEAGAKEMLVSCSYPIRDNDGNIVGVALADVSLEHLQRISEYLQVYPNSYFSITSNTGIDIVPSPDTIPGRKYHIYTEDIDVNGWTINIIIPDDEIYGELKKVGLLVNILMILGFAILMFIMYHSAKNILNLVEINNQKQRMDKELTIAQNIQMAMLPKTFPPYADRQDLNIAGIVIPAKQVGGDLYDFHIRDNKLIFCIGDVSGKGVPAALVMAVTCSLFRTISAHESKPERIMTMLNDTMSESNDQNMFVTLFLGILDLTTNTLEYCNAGHNSPILLAGNRTEVLPSIPNLPLGVLSGFTFTGQSINFNPNDSLFLYTDGLTEAENIYKELYGEERMIEEIKKWDTYLTAEQQVIALQHSVSDFVGNAEQSDDLTMMSIRFLPTETPDGIANRQDNTKHRIVMRNDIQQIPTLAEWVEGLNIPEALNMTINLALEEAVTNVMLYAYPNANGSVIIDAEKTDGKIVFTISDTGIPFDPTKQKEADITLSAEERSIGGLGIHLVRQIMDSISYERKDNKNILTLEKKLF